MGVLDDLVPGLEGFEWDAGNTDKNRLRHAVRQGEAEQALLNTPPVLAADITHSQAEAAVRRVGPDRHGREDWRSCLPFATTEFA